MTYTCTFCHKEYKRKSYYDRHIVTCELFHISSKQRKEICEKEQDTPSSYKMYEMIVALANKCERLESQVTEMTKWMSQKQKKVRVKEWITNSFSKPSIEYSKLFDNIEITEDMLNTIYSRGIVDFTVMFIKKRLMFGEEGEKETRNASDKYEQDNTCSMITINRQGRVFYVYNESEWQLQKSPEFAGLCGNIFNEIQKTFNTWWYNQGTDMLNEENSRLQKLIYKPITEPNRFKSIGTVRNKIYEFCKITLPAFVKEEETSQ